MGYIDSNLIPGEEVVHRARLHWAILLPGILLTLVVIGLFLLIPALIRRHTTEMAVTNKRVIIKTGWISRSTLEMNLSKIENVGVEQGLWGRMMDFGTIIIVGTGGTREPFAKVAAPLEFRKAVQAQIDARSMA